MNFQILIGAELDGMTLTSKDRYFVFTRKGQDYKLPINSISNVYKNEQFKKEVFFTITFTNDVSATAKGLKADYETIYKMQFFTPKETFSISEYTYEDKLKENLLILIVIGVIALILLFKCSSSSDTSLITATASNFVPQECNYLSSLGLPTNAYHATQDGDEHICLANYLQVGTMDRTGGESVLDFAVEGTSSQITNTYLRASYNNKSSNAAAREKFMQASRELVSKTTSQEMPHKLVQAIKNGREFTGTLNGKKVTLEMKKRNNYSQGKAQGYGYTHTLTIN